MSGRDRRAAELTGRLGETAATWLLRGKGFRILGRRFKTPVGELDIVARRGRLLVFCEVKTRALADDGLAALDGRQQQRILRAAQWYLGYRPALAGLDYRFDLIAVSPWRLPRHVIDVLRT